jgi:hypothetical protein
VVWIDNRAVFERELAGRLCRRHAEALVVPRGWTLDDRREPVPKLFVTKDVPAPAAPRAPRRGGVSRDEARQVQQELPLHHGGDADETSFAVDEPPSVAAVVDADESAQVDESAEVDGSAQLDEVVDPDETRAVPWSPRLVPAEPDDPSGPVFGRLLGRAFGARSRDDDES